jgi:hypothetical protein
VRKKRIPGLDRIREEREAAKKPGFLKKNWQYLTSVVIAIGWMLTNSTIVMTNLEELPGKTRGLYNTFLSWHYDDDLWNASWSDNVEGLIGDNPLTDTGGYLRLSAERGEIGGEISTKQLCNAFPLSNFVMIHGSLTLGKFRGYGWDYIRGNETKLFAFEMTLRDDFFIEIIPVDDPHHLLPPKMVLARLKAEGSPYGMSTETKQENYCEEDRTAALKELHKAMKSKNIVRPRVNE